MSRRRHRQAPPAAKPAGKALMWAVVLTCALVTVLLLRLARDILAQLQALGGSGGANSTRLLTGLFVAMCLAGFTVAALWAALKKALGRDRTTEE